MIAFSFNSVRIFYYLGMLILLIISLLWRGRARLWRLPILSSIQKHRIRRSKNKSKAKFDLDYWLKQVDILEAKEAERYRECVSPYLELPREEPRDNRLATASWIIDAWYHWRWIHSAEGQAMIDEDQTRLTNYHTNRRKQFFRRLYRRFRNPSEQCQTTVTNHSHTIPVEMTSNHVEISTLPASSTFDIFQPPRRVASWPRLQTAQILVDSPRSALQIQLARQKLLQHSKRIRFSS